MNLKSYIKRAIGWLVWRLWGRRQAIARLRELSGIASKAYGKNSIEPAKRGSRSSYPAVHPLRLDDAHLEYYANNDRLPKPDTDDSGLN